MHYGLPIPGHGQPRVECAVEPVTWWYKSRPATGYSILLPDRWRFTRYLLFWLLHLNPLSFFRMRVTYPPSVSIRGDLPANSWLSYPRLLQKEHLRGKGRQYKNRVTLRTFTIGEVQKNLLVGSFFCLMFYVLKPFQAVIITDEEYPVRPAFSLLTKILDEFTTKVPQSSFSQPSSISFPEITSYIQKYQDPRQADTIMRVQQELDETKIVLVCSKVQSDAFHLTDVAA